MWRRGLWIGVLGLGVLALPGAAVAGEESAAPEERLAAAIRIPSISPEDPTTRDEAVFLGFHAFLAESFPRAHAALERESVNRLSLLYTWPGSDAGLAPLLLTAHFDVVPVPADSRERWDHDPFGGVIADGHVWGRGALDDKVGVMGMIEAVERLVAADFRPRRTLLLAFGHDEELGGPDGAGATAKLLRERGVRPWMSLDEGMAIMAGGDFAGVQVPVALIGVAEKGYANVRLIAKAEGGHSSIPPPTGAIGTLARAITKLEESPMPVRLDGVVGEMLDALSEHQGFMTGLITRNRWLTGPLLRRRLAASPATNAMMRTTTAVTIVSGGVKANVLPSEASATVNFRLLPGDDAESVRAHVGRVVGPDIEVLVALASKPSKVSSTDSDAYALIRRSLDQVFPGVAVAPGLVLGGTDTKHYIDLVEHAYRFTPMQVGPSDLPRIHGVNERIGVDVYRRVIDFYAELIRSSADAGTPAP